MIRQHRQVGVFLFFGLGAFETQAKGFKVVFGPAGKASEKY
jgi:hypothetical protein